MSLSAQAQAFIDQNNSSTTNLIANGTFVGKTTSCLYYTKLIVTFKMSQACSLTLTQSQDGLDPDLTEVFTSAADVEKVVRISLSYPYYRLALTNNGAITSTYVRLQSILKSSLFDEADLITLGSGRAVLYESPGSDDFFQRTVVSSTISITQTDTNIIINYSAGSSTIPYMGGSYITIVGNAINCMIPDLSTSVGGGIPIFDGITNGVIAYKSLNAAGSYVSLTTTGGLITLNSTQIFQTAGSYVSLTNGQLDAQTGSISSSTLGVTGVWPDFTLTNSNIAIAGSYISITGNVISTTGDVEATRIVLAGAGISILGEEGPTTTVINTGVISATASSGINIGGTTSIVIQNTMMDKTVTLSSATLGITGVYPDFVLTNSDISVAGSYISITGNVVSVTGDVEATRVILGGAGISISGPNGATTTVTNEGVLNVVSGSYITVSANTGLNIQINSTNTVLNATNLGVPSYAVYDALSSGGILSFKSLEPGSYISIVPTNTSLMISSSNTVLNGSNLGEASYAVYNSLSNGVLTFKSLNAGSNITLVPSDTTISINAPASGTSAKQIFVTGIRSNTPNNKIALGASETSGNERFTLGTLMPSGGVISKLYTLAQGGADTYSFALNVNNADTALAVSVVAGITGINLDTSVTVNTGDLVCFSYTSLATGNGYIASVLFEF